MSGGEVYGRLSIRKDLIRIRTYITFIVCIVFVVAV